MGCRKFIDLLKKEVVPALGCTEPIAVALAAAKGKEVLGCLPDSIEVLLSRNVLKNGMGVGIPGTGMTGLDIAAALGAVGGNSLLGLEVLGAVEDIHRNQAKTLLEQKRVSVSLKNVQDKLYIEVISRKDNDISRVIIKDKHTNIIRIEHNNSILFEEAETEAALSSSNDKVELTVESIFQFVSEVPFDEIKFLLDGAKMNRIVSEEGLTKEYGLGVGRTIFNSIKKGLLSDDIEAYAMAVTAGGADARMAGCTYPVMSSAGSGNQGLTAILPVAAAAEKLKSTEEQLARALALSHLITIHIKSYMGRLSALCGCGVAASIGASCAITYLFGGELKNIKYTIKNMIGNVSGMICDGAKPGCALKLCTAVSAAVQSAILALNGLEISEKDGIIDRDVEKTIQNLGLIASRGMVDTDEVILDIMISK